MKNIIYILIFFSCFNVYGQESWNEVNSNVKVIPQPSYDSTFVLSAPSRSVLAQGQANWTPARSYRVYTALLTQSGTDAPVATVLENTLGFTVYWFREGTGWYTMRCDNNIGTCEGFPFGKTWGVAGGVSDDNVENEGGWTKFIEGGSNLWQLFVYDLTGARTDNGLVACSIEIKVYP